MVNKKTEKANPGKVLKNKFLLIFVSSFLSIVIIFGAVLGIVSAIRSSRAFVKYNGLVMGEEEVNYFLGYYKYKYMSMLSASGVGGVVDEPAFWNSSPEGSEETYGDGLRAGAKLYIQQLMAASYLFDSHKSLTKSEREKIKNAAKAVVKYSEAEGDVETFDKYAKLYGFSYSSLSDVVKYIYKADNVKDTIYGENGYNLKNFILPDAKRFCEEYLSEYTHVKLLIIRTETKYKLDDKGQLIKGEDGFYETVALTAEEKAERLEKINSIREYIDAIGTDEPQMSAEMFDRYLETLDEGDEEMYIDGYYFHPSATYTQNFPKEYSSVVERAYEMEIGDYSDVTVDGAVCFIYKYAPTSDIYTSTIAEDCFTDFYSDLATKLFDESLSFYTDEVEFSEKYDEIDITLIPYNYKYIPRF